MSVLTYEEWKSQVGIIENKEDILHITEENHGKDVREVIDEMLQQLYNNYLTQQYGGE
jgi:hypothetical protein